MFEPPRCPNPACSAHASPRAGFFRRKGGYQPKCRAQPVPRFKCKLCNLGFSRQTFRVDYRDHKPHLNAELVSRLASGGGLRQSARELRLSLWGVQKKFRKLATQLCRLHDNLLRRVDVTVAFALDEAETFEGNRIARPLTVPVVIESQTMFVAGACSGRLPSRPQHRGADRNTVAADAERDGRRPDDSRRVVAAMLAKAARLVAVQPELSVRSDRKTSYPKLIRAAFGTRSDARPRAIVHERVSSAAPRTPRNPLHRINLTLAMIRDQLGRMRRRSWLHTKRRVYLDLHLGLFACYRNYVRVRFNGEERSPAELLGLLPRRLTIRELLGWRQDQGREHSTHPLARRGESVAEWRAPVDSVGEEPEPA